MVGGIERFAETFAGLEDQYVLIGGAACDIAFAREGLSFRATKDLDVVLVVESLNREFGDRLWGFIQGGGYRSRAGSSGRPRLFRFDKPARADYPAMIELFARTGLRQRDGSSGALHTMRQKNRPFGALVLR